MRWMTGVFLAAAALGGCDLLVREPAAPTAPPPVTAPTADTQLQQQAGSTYSDFAAALEGRYSPDTLGLGAGDRARLWRAMASSRSSVMTGGGAEALVFQGCADAGCNEGLGIVAIDTTTGGAFVGVVDAGGAEVLLPNDRVEALLRLSSPTRNWRDPAPAEPQASLPSAEATTP
jgi:hypothetical protein